MWHLLIKKNNLYWCALEKNYEIHNYGSHCLIHQYKHNFFVLLYSCVVYIHGYVNICMCLGKCMWVCIHMCVCTCGILILFVKAKSLTEPGACQFQSFQLVSFTRDSLELLPSPLGCRILTYLSSIHVRFYPQSSCLQFKQFIHVSSSKHNFNYIKSTGKCQ